MQLTCLQIGLQMTIIYSSLGIIPMSNSIVESSACSSALIADSFCLQIWDQPISRQSLGYCDVNAQNRLLDYCDDDVEKIDKKCKSGIEAGGSKDTKESKVNCSRNDDNREMMEMNLNQVSNYSYGEAEALTDEIEESQLFEEVLRIKEILDNKFPSPGLHLALDACAAAAVATFLRVPLALFGKSFSTFIPVHGRSELEIAENGIKIVNDAYNANPDSTRSAIDLLRAIECKGRKVAILGDMLELGPKEIVFHELILQHCIDARIDLVALVGKQFLTAAENLNIG